MRLTGRKRRHQRIRKKIKGTQTRPRLCVFRSNRNISAQIIDDTQQKVLFGVSSAALKELNKKNKIEVAMEIGKRIGKLALEKGIKQVAFDRGGYRYHGRVKALAQGAREAGLKF
ncbi:MAG TPA: 50S ribosomal protein L18 [candidate division WOR-3 bacterium]|uniref:Large ribosomal subunit protein uL18 n=1 Tax=candidate division WOR-3 bacterium TaxID=2052148 RepID=A0A9C9EQ12_UNCW3|nr:50S ribosomal protein L18 [candidate division WOR-3 bacterium]